ncbi:MAG TPA: hypothetical protein VNJ04_19625 [Gemmatimonadaceae bacterium]|nr:hypothetical protein [Gemmatimonadaceae bacterium]
MSTTIRRTDGGYFTTPNRWYDAGYAKAAPGSVTTVYGFLCRWADNTTPESAQPMRLIAEQCGLTENVARQAVRTLESWNVLTRDSGRGHHAINRWTLNQLQPESPLYPQKTRPKESVPLPESEVTESEPPLTDLTNQPEQKDTETTGVVSPSSGDEDVSRPEPKRSTIDERFDRFWSVVPRKVGKEAARRWWRRTKPNDALTETMILAMERHKRSPDWLKDGGAFIPHPTTWLGRGGWNDELETTVDDGVYLAYFGTRNIERMAEMLGRYDSTFGDGWVRVALRKLAGEVPGLSQQQVKDGMSVGMDRIADRFRQRDKPVTSPTKFAYYTLLDALHEQEGVTA